MAISRFSGFIGDSIGTSIRWVANQIYDAKNYLQEAAAFISKRVQRLWLDKTDIKNFQLGTSDVNLILKKLASGYAVPGEKFDELQVNCFRRVKSKLNKHYTLAPTSKDAESPKQNISAPFFLQTIRNFLLEHPATNSTLLIPLLLCRDYFGLLERRHLAFLYIDLVKKQILVLDSEPNDPFYRHKLAEPAVQKEIAQLLERQYDCQFHYLGLQNNDYSCGYWVLAMIEFLLQGGSIDSLLDPTQAPEVLKKIQNALNNLPTSNNKYQYVEQRYGVHLRPEDSGTDNGIYDSNNYADLFGLNDARINDAKNLTSIILEKLTAQSITETDKNDHAELENNWQIMTPPAPPRNTAEKKPAMSRANSDYGFFSLSRSVEAAPPLRDNYSQQDFSPPLSPCTARKD